MKIRRMLSVSLSLAVASVSQPWSIYAEVLGASDNGEPVETIAEAAQASPAAPALDGQDQTSLQKMFRRWNVAPQRYESLSPAKKAELLRGMAVLESGLRLEIAQLQRIAGEGWRQYVTPEGLLTPEGRALLQDAQAKEPGRFAGLNLSKSGIDPKTIEKIKADVAGGADGESLAQRANALFEGVRPSAPMVVGEVATAGAGLLGAQQLNSALSLQSSALAVKDLALAAGAQAHASQAAAMSLAAQGNLAAAQQMGLQAQQQGAQALAYKAQATATGEQAKAAAHKATVLTKVAGVIAAADGAWDLYKGITEKGKMNAALALERSYLDAYAEAASGTAPQGISRIAVAYAEFLGGKAGDEHADIIAGALRETFQGLTPDIAQAALGATQELISRLEQGVDKADERIKIGAGKTVAGATMVQGAAASNILLPQIAAVVYLFLSIYQHRDKIREFHRRNVEAYNKSQAAQPQGPWPRTAGD